MRMWGWRPGDIVDVGARFRAEHSAWLTHALRTGYGYPRIPARPAHSGGFDRLMQRPGGRRLASRWWRIAFERLGVG